MKAEWLYVGRGTGYCEKKRYVVGSVELIWQDQDWKNNGYWWNEGVVSLCAKQVHAFTNLELAPGELVRIPAGSKIVFPAMEHINQK